MQNSSQFTRSATPALRLQPLIGVHPSRFCDDRGVVIAFGYKRIELTDEADLRTLLDLGRLDPTEGEVESDVTALREALELGYAGEVRELALDDGEARTLNRRLIRHSSHGGQVLPPGLADLRKGLEAYVAELEYRDGAGR